MNTGQSITLGLGASLALASLWRGQQLQPLWRVLSNQDTTTQLVPILKNIGLDALFLIVAVWLAGLSDDASKMTGALMVGLWLLFLMRGNHGTESGSGAKVATKNFHLGNPASWIAV